MRNILLTSVAMCGLVLAPAAFAPAFAQSGTTQNPPSPNASSQMPQPMNSAPVGATAAAPQANPSGALGGPVATVSGASPKVAAMPMRKPVHVAYARAAMKRDPMVQDAAMTDSSVPPTSAYRGGVGSPLSTQATDLKPSTGEKMGSRLPMPPTSGDTPRDLLTAAQTALNKGQTGAAQQALEMAETRVLSRTTDPSLANQPDQRAMVANISKARQALGARDTTGAKRAIAMALTDPVPPPGPAVTTGPAGMPATMMRTN
jgi:hypothetical protein